MRQRREAGRLRQWGLESGGYILFLGRFSPEKNCDFLVRAYQQMDTPVKLVLAGEVACIPRNTPRGSAGAESDRIRVLDWVSGEALDELLTNAMLLVLPSDLEGLSLALLDAMGAGVCVLASDIPENRELVDGSGFTFRRGDQNDLERMLRLLISEPEIRKAAARKARERVWEHYLWGRVAREIEGSSIGAGRGRQSPQACGGAGNRLPSAGRVASRLRPAGVRPILTTDDRLSPTPTTNGE